MRPHSVEAAEFSLRPGPRARVTAGAGSDGGRGTPLRPTQTRGVELHEAAEGISVMGPLEHSVLEVALDGRPMEGISVLDPLEHSVLEVALDGRPMEGISVLEPLEHSVLDVALDRGDSSFVKVDVSDPLEHSGLDRADNVVPGLVPPESLEHSVLVVPL